MSFFFQIGFCFLFAAKMYVAAKTSGEKGTPTPIAKQKCVVCLRPFVEKCHPFCIALKDESDWQYLRERIENLKLDIKALEDMV